MTWKLSGLCSDTWKKHLTRLLGSKSLPFPSWKVFHKQSLSITIIDFLPPTIIVSERALSCADNVSAKHWTLRDVSCTFPLMSTCSNEQCSASVTITENSSNICPKDIGRSAAKIVEILANAPLQKLLLLNQNVFLPHLKGNVRVATFQANSFLDYISENLRLIGSYIRIIICMNTYRCLWYHHTLLLLICWGCISKQHMSVRHRGPKFMDWWYIFPPRKKP